MFHENGKPFPIKRKHSTRIRLTRSCRLTSVFSGSPPLPGFSVFPSCLKNTFCSRASKHFHPYRAAMTLIPSLLFFLQSIAICIFILSQLTLYCKSVFIVLIHNFSLELLCIFYNKNQPPIIFSLFFLLFPFFDSQSIVLQNISAIRFPPTIGSSFMGQRPFAGQGLSYNKNAPVISTRTYLFHSFYFM